MALVKAGYENIKSIVTTFDSGGDTGRMRTDERGKIMAFSDYWRSLISLWQDGDQKAIWEEMLQFRDGRDRNFGNAFFQFMAEKVGNITDVDELFSKLTGAKLQGEVVPVSLEPSNICFRTKSGNSYCGENYLDGLRMSSDVVEEIWLEPVVSANKEAIKAINNADVIVVCPGSMYGSVLINLLPNGMKEAYRQSKARKVLMTNLMSVANENDGFTQGEYVKMFGKYLKMKEPFDLVVMADFEKLEQKLLRKVYQNYELEHSVPIKDNKKENPFKTDVIDIAKIEEKNLRLRHSVTKLEKYFRKCEWLEN
jgi:uncharacterized cofD-like protein